jgi:hypothetical protein
VDKQEGSVDNYIYQTIIISLTQVSTLPKTDEMGIMERLCQSEPTNRTPDTALAHMGFVPGLQQKPVVSF